MNDELPPETITVTYCDKCGRDDIVGQISKRHFVRGSLCVGGTLKDVIYRCDDTTITSTKPE